MASAFMKIGLTSQYPFRPRLLATRKRWQTDGAAHACVSITVIFFCALGRSNAWSQNINRPDETVFGMSRRESPLSATVSIWDHCANFDCKFTLPALEHS